MLFNRFSSEGLSLKTSLTKSVTLVLPTRDNSIVQRRQPTNTVVVTPVWTPQVHKLSYISFNVQKKIISLMNRHDVATCWSITSRLLMWTPKVSVQVQHIAQLLCASFLYPLLSPQILVERKRPFYCLERSLLGNRTSGPALRESRGGTFQFPVWECRATTPLWSRRAKFREILMSLQLIVLIKPASDAIFAE